MFSIVMPVYNGEKFIDKAIESILAQTFSDWELIIVDDGSSDNTQNVLSKYKEKENIHIFRQKNQGVSAARNRAMEEAKRDYIVFLDADDVWEKEHLEIMKNLISKYPNAGLYGTFSKAELVNGGEITECNFFKDKGEDYYTEDFFFDYFNDKSAKMFTVITTCILKAALEKTGGFPVGCKIGEDLELSLKVAAYYPVALSRKITATYVKTNSTATKDQSFDPNWGFFETVEKLYKDEQIPLSKRENLKKLMQWFSMRRFRHYIIDGNKKKAKEVYKNTDKRYISKKDRMINSVLAILPAFVVRLVFVIRWRGKA